jgi:ferric-dicitrate binding protein FerR (iron transport regulator)
MFENETMQEIAVKLERWYNVKIAIDNKEIGNYHFTGSFTNETIDQVLTAMQLITPFKVKTNNNDIIIY